MLLMANLSNTDLCKKRNDWNPGKWVLIWEYSMRAFQWISKWPGFDGFQRCLHSCTLDESSPSIGRVNKSDKIHACRGHETEVELSCLTLH